MFKKIVASLTSKASKPVMAKQRPPVRLSRDEHSISRQNISKSALKVMYRLQDAGYQAYLVGGGVRDLLLNLNPKDFDVATDATPEQVKQTFKNARIVGRRFRIAHVMFGREIIEVTTFRGDHAPSSPQDKARKNQKSVQSQSGMLLRDNVYGTLEDDARRRDFTVNALYYTVDGFQLIDYHQGLEDIAAKQLRIIGDPESRYCEDPVRMLRAVRFAAKLGFEIEAQTKAPIRALAPLLRDIPPARLFDESLKLFLNGKARACFAGLKDQGIDKVLFPELVVDEEQGRYDRFIDQALATTDKRIAAHKSVTPAYLYACFMYPAYLRAKQALIAQGLPPHTANHEAAASAIYSQTQVIAVPKRFQITIREIWDLQFRLQNRGGKRAERALTHPRFRAAFDFLGLIADTLEPSQAELYQWWETYQHSDEAAQLKMQSTAPEEPKPRRRRRAPKSKSST